MAFDAIVVGSGISGGWVAKELCERGLKVLMLERGPDVEHGAGYSHDEAARLRRRDDQVPAEELALHYPFHESVGYALFNSNKKFWASEHEHPYETPPGKPYRWIRGYQLGGRSLTWGRQSYRWAPDDFTSNQKDGHGVDWPIRYEDVAPWYDHVEAFAGVSGGFDDIPQLPDGDFLPPFPFNCVEEVARDRIEAAFPTRRMIMGRTANLSRVTKAQTDLGRKRCEQHVRCHHGCPLGSYFSSQAATLPAARATGNLTVVTDAIVESVVYDPAGMRVSGVRVIDRLRKSGKIYEARLVFLNASAINTAAILLNSRSDAFPRGLANSSDQVGRNLMDHVSCKAVLGRFPGFEDAQDDQADRPTGIYIPRYANVTEGDKPFLRGFGMQGGAHKRRWPESQSDDAVPRKKAWVFSLLPFGEVLPNPENRMTLSASRVDAWGIPVPVIDAAHGENEAKMMREAARDAAAMLAAAGCVEITPWEEASAYMSPPGDRIHEMGTARMGRDPRTSVLNGWGQAHDVANLFISDGAVMTSSASMNPSLTYMALSARAAHHAADLLEQEGLPVKRIGLQLYTLRHAFAADPLGALERIRQVGYDEIEVAAPPETDFAPLAARMREIGLGSPSMHVGLAEMTAQPGKVLDAAKILGCRFIVLPFVNPEGADWKRVVAELTAFARRARDAGDFRVAYHHHHFEFDRSRGFRPFDVLVGESDPALIHFELDVYWLKRGGEDPQAMIETLGARVKLLHLKDMGVDGKFADVGSGTLDFAALVTAGRSVGVEHFFVEHDAPPEPGWPSVEASLRYLRGFVQA